MDAWELASHFNTTLSHDYNQICAPQAFRSAPTETDLVEESHREIDMLVSSIDAYALE